MGGATDPNLRNYQDRKGGGNNLKFFINTTFNYPTMAEAYRVAALNGINRLV